MQPPEDEEAQQGVSCTCQRHPVEYRCSGSPGAKPQWLVCHPLGDEVVEAWLFDRTASVSRAWSLGKRGQDKLSIAEASEEGLILIAGEKPDGGKGPEASDHEGKSEWLEAWLLVGHKARKEATLPMARGIKRGRLALFDLDGDGAREVIHRFGPRLQTLHRDRNKDPYKPGSATNFVPYSAKKPMPQARLPRFCACAGRKKASHCCPYQVFANLRPPARRFW